MKELGDALDRLRDALWEPFEPHVMKVYEWLKKVVG